PGFLLRRRVLRGIISPPSNSMLSFLGFQRDGREARLPPLRAFSFEGRNSVDGSLACHIGL
ncbi:TPA: hypothetical protein ACXEYS_005234, partial [Escherichia coli]